MLVISISDYLPYFSCEVVVCFIFKFFWSYLINVYWVPVRCPRQCQVLGITSVNKIVKGSKVMDVTYMVEDTENKSADQLYNIRQQ